MKECKKCLYYRNKQKCSECSRMSNVMDNTPMFTPNTNYNRIQSMSIEEMAMFFVINKFSDFPNSPCHVCEYGDEPCCLKKDGCTTEHKVKVYQRWLESEVGSNV